jgi:hypothetical protein
MNEILDLRNNLEKRLDELLIENISEEIRGFGKFDVALLEKEVGEEFKDSVEEHLGKLGCSIENLDECPIGNSDESYFRELIDEFDRHRKTLIRLKQVTQIDEFNEIWDDVKSALDFIGKHPIDYFSSEQVTFDDRVTELTEFFEISVHEFVELIKKRDSFLTFVTSMFYTKTV